MRRQILPLMVLCMHICMCQHAEEHSKHVFEKQLTDDANKQIKQNSRAATKAAQKLIKVVDKFEQETSTLNNLDAKLKGTKSLDTMAHLLDKMPDGLGHKQPLASSLKTPLEKALFRSGPHQLPLATKEPPLATSKKDPLQSPINKTPPATPTPASLKKRSVSTTIADLSADDIQYPHLSHPSGLSAQNRADMNSELDGIQGDIEHLQTQHLGWEGTHSREVSTVGISFGDEPYALS